MDLASFFLWLFWCTHVYPYHWARNSQGSATRFLIITSRQLRRKVLWKIQKVRLEVSDYTEPFLYYKEQLNNVFKYQNPICLNECTNGYRLLQEQRKKSTTKVKCMSTEMHIKGANKSRQYSQEFSIDLVSFHSLHGGILQISGPPTGCCPFL